MKRLIIMLILFVVVISFGILSINSALKITLPIGWQRSWDYSAICTAQLNPPPLGWPFAFYIGGCPGQGWDFLGVALDLIVLVGMFVVLGKYYKKT